MSKEYKGHESYGLIRWSRLSGTSHRRLFGSALDKHYSTVRLTIHRAQRAFDLNQDWYYPDKEIIELELSVTQFAEFLTAPNMGTGVPCTIRHREGRQMEDPPNEGVEAERVQADFDVKAKELGQKMRNITAIIDKVLQKKTINKADRATIKDGYKRLLMEVEANMPFVLSQFREASAKVTQAGKAEVEAFTTHFIHAMGLQAVEDMQKLLPEKTETEPETKAFDIDTDPWPDGRK